MYIFAVQFGMWRSWLAHHVRDVGVGRSSRLIPTKGLLKAGLFLNKYLFREVAQLASALRSGRRGRVFESPLPDRKRFAIANLFLLREEVTKLLRISCISPLNPLQGTAKLRFGEKVTSTFFYPIQTFPKGRLFPDKMQSQTFFCYGKR